MSDEARKMLEASAAKIDQSLVKEHSKEAVSLVCMEKMLRLVDEHGEQGIKKVQFFPNWNEGASPRHFPTGYAMLFDINAAPVVPEAFPTDMLYGGTTAFRIPSSALSGSPLSMTGITEHATQIVKRINGALDMNNNLPDAYIGLYENKRRGERTFEYTYWAVTRSVDPSLNATLATEIEAHKDQRLSTLLDSTQSLRHTVFNKQREARASKISQLLNSLGIYVDSQTILNGKEDGSYIDNACFTLHEASAGKNEAMLYSDTIPVASGAVLSSGVVLSGNIELGPTILRGSANRTNNNLQVFPSTTGTTMPMWEAAKLPNVLDLGTHSCMSANNRWVWSNTAVEHHPLLARNAFRPRNSAWKRMEQNAGFIDDKSIALEPVAIKLTTLI